MRSGQKRGMVETDIKVAFVYYSFSSFVKNDYEILSKHFDVIKVNYRQIWDIYRIMMAVMKSDVSFTWFAGGHAFIAVLFSKIFRKKSIVIVGGNDVAAVPEINYGQFTLGWHKKMYTKFALKCANVVLVVDPSLKEDAVKNAKVSGENIEYLPTGYDSNYWKRKVEKENVVLTVGSVNKSVVKRKGFETFVKAAKYFPEIRFILVGRHIDDSVDHLKSIAKPNVEFTGFVSDEDLLNWYQKAKVYCQLSRYEGLPNALSEAMLCECMPVGTEYCGIPNAIGDTGFYVPYGNTEATVEAINKALNSNKGKDARERVKNMFPVENRAGKLIELVNELNHNKGRT